MSFENQKKNFLEKEDKSKIGKIDEKIHDLVNKINSDPDYYTTSSCAGRIVLIEGKRKPAKWIYVSHKEIKFEEIEKIIDNLSGEIWLRQEPMIIHIACKTIEKAQKLVNKAREIGFKRSGIQATEKKIVIEIASTEIINTLIYDNKKLVNNEYIKIILEKANEKLKQNWEKIKKFEEIIHTDKEV